MCVTAESAVKNVQDVCEKHVIAPSSNKGMPASQQASRAIWMDACMPMHEKVMMCIIPSQKCVRAYLRPAVNSHSREEHGGNAGAYQQRMCYYPTMMPRYSITFEAQYIHIYTHTHAHTQKTRPVGIWCVQIPHGTLLLQLHLLMLFLILELKGLGSCFLALLVRLSLSFQG